MIKKIVEILCHMLMLEMTMFQTTTRKGQCQFEIHQYPLEQWLTLHDMGGSMIPSPPPPPPQKKKCFCPLCWNALQWTLSVFFSFFTLVFGLKVNLTSIFCCFVWLKLWMVAIYVIKHILVGELTPGLTPVSVCYQPNWMKVIRIRPWGDDSLNN